MNDLTSNTEATENKVQFLNFAYTVKGFQCHSNNYLQLLELKEKNNNITIHVIVVVTQCFDTTGHAPTQTYLHGSLVDNVFSSKVLN